MHGRSSASAVATRNQIHLAFPPSPLEHNAFAIAFCSDNIDHESHRADRFGPKVCMETASIYHSTHWAEERWTAAKEKGTKLLKPCASRSPHNGIKFMFAWTRWQLHLGVACDVISPIFVLRPHLEVHERPSLDRCRRIVYINGVIPNSREVCAQLRPVVILAV